ncbi:MAG: nucleotidyltransferase domain-containing protein, partial [Dehalococcoidia bacterium]
YERQVARDIGISYGSANRALNSLHTTGTIKRRQEGRMFFYSVDSTSTVIIELKKLINIMLIEPLVEVIKHDTSRIVLFGSCARGFDDSRSDVDLFIAAFHRERVIEAVHDFQFPRGYEIVRIKPVIKTPVELIMSEDADRMFIDEIEKGITLWERMRE